MWEGESFEDKKKSNVTVARGCSDFVGLPSCNLSLCEVHERTVGYSEYIGALCLMKGILYS